MGGCVGPVELFIVFIAACRVVWKRRLDESSPVSNDADTKVDAVEQMTAVEMEGVERATIWPVLMQCVPSCWGCGQIFKCSYHAVECRRRERPPVGRTRAITPFPGRGSSR